jgi:hypothetical protein
MKIFNPIYRNKQMVGSLILCVIGVTYIVAIDLCVLCVWSGWFHSFARKSTQIWRC